MKLTVTFSVTDQTSAIELARLLQRVTTVYTDTVALDALRLALREADVDAVETKKVK